jgi:Right handed beta helix region
VMNQGPGDGVTVSGSFNRIARNVFNVGFQGIEVTSGQANVVARNLVLNAGGDGVLTDAQATNTIIIRNLVGHSAADGIDVKSASTAILLNTANNNGSYGIEAVPGVVAFGNKASGNGNPLQCLNLTCT